MSHATLTNFNVTIVQQAHCTWIYNKKNPENSVENGGKDGRKRRKKFGEY